jgi:Ca2+-binding EF-hand superfamily protein
MATSEEEVKECFKVFDTDNDSKIAISEIGLVIRALGKAPLQKEIEAIEAEAGGDGVVDFAQFMNFYRRKFRRPQDLEKEMREAFRALDATGYAKHPPRRSIRVVTFSCSATSRR